MTITKNDVEKIAWLSRIKINPEEIEGYQHQLARILTLAESMNAADTDHLLPMTNPLEDKLSLRSDKVTESDQHELFQRLAPLVAEDLYLVPTVIEES